MRYYLPFRTAIPHPKVDYLRVTHPFATGNHQFLPAFARFFDFSSLLTGAFSLLDCPFDLHGSRTPLALILSQDQTLRKLFKSFDSFTSFGSLSPSSDSSSATLQLLRCQRFKGARVNSSRFLAPVKSPLKALLTQQLSLRENLSGEIQTALHPLPTSLPNTT